MPGCHAAADRRVPAYALTDNERTVTADHVARIPVRNPEIIEVAWHYGMTIRTCIPADPESKGGSEVTVCIVKADLVPTNVNLLPGYRTFSQLETACRQFCTEVNARVHRETRHQPGGDARRRAAAPAPAAQGAVHRGVRHAQQPRRQLLTHVPVASAADATWGDQIL
jgi:hypothetical protein